MDRRQTECEFGFAEATIPVQYQEIISAQDQVVLSGPLGHNGKLDERMECLPQFLLNHPRASLDFHLLFFAHDKVKLLYVRWSAENTFQIQLPSAVSYDTLAATNILVIQVSLTRKSTNG